MDKSYVTMGLCPICEKENGSILMDRRLRDTFDRYTMTAEPCDKCRAEHLTDKGVLILCEGRGIIVMTDKTFKKAFPTMTIPPKRIAQCKQDLFDLIAKNIGHAKQ
jgi:hypothetical protein